MEDASSVAGLLITTEAMVADKPEKPGAGGAPGMPDMGGMGGMGGMMQPPKSTNFKTPGFPGVFL